MQIKSSCNFSRHFWPHVTWIASEGKGEWKIDDNAADTSSRSWISTNFSNWNALGSRRDENRKTLKERKLRLRVATMREEDPLSRENFWVQGNFRFQFDVSYSWTGVWGVSVWRAITNACAKSHSFRNILGRGTIFYDRRWQHSRKNLFKTLTKGEKWREREREQTAINHVALAKPKNVFVI